MGFERQREPIEGVGSIRYVLIAPTMFFGPLVISACLLQDDTIELVSVIEDGDNRGRSRDVIRLRFG
jgi:hypothetical protein